MLSEPSHARWRSSPPRSDSPAWPVALCSRQGAWRCEGVAGQAARWL